MHLKGQAGSIGSEHWADEVGSRTARYSSCLDLKKITPPGGPAPLGLRQGVIHIARRRRSVRPGLLSLLKLSKLAEFCSVLAARDRNGKLDTTSHRERTVDAVGDLVGFMVGLFDGTFYCRLNRRSTSSIGQCLGEPSFRAASPPPP